MAENKKVKKTTRSAKTLTDPPKARQTKTASKTVKSASKKTATTTKKPVSTKPVAKRDIKKETPKKVSTEATRPSSKRMEGLIKKNTVSQQELYDLIQKKAYLIFESRGYEQGRELEHWVEAERAVLQDIQT